MKPLNSSVFLLAIAMIFVQSCTKTDSSARASYKIEKISDKSFKDFLANAKKPVCVQFYANWCKPSQRLDPIYSELAKRFRDKIIFAKVDVKEAPHIVEDYEVESLPTIIFNPENKKDKKVLIGFAKQEELQEFLNSCLANESKDKPASTSTD